MNGIQTIYNSFIKDYEDLHKRYVASNMKLNSLSLALSQIKREGDIDITPAVDLLKASISKEQHFNNELCNQVINLGSFLIKYEQEAKDFGLELNEVRRIRGY